jgi:hypothetical protein
MLRTVHEQAGYTRQRASGGILVLRLHDARPETLAAWREDCFRIMGTWRGASRLRYLHDIRGAQSMTPYGVECVAAVLRHMRGIPVVDGRGAVLHSNAGIANVLGGFLNRRRYAGWRLRFFTDEDAALRWLGE